MHQIAGAIRCIASGMTKGNGKDDIVADGDVMHFRFNN